MYTHSDSSRDCRVEANLRNYGTEAKENPLSSEPIPTPSDASLLYV